MKGHSLMIQEKKSDKNCQWHDCKFLAMKHVDFGRRVFSEPLSASVTHLNLCDAHTDEIRHTYQDVAQQDISTFN